MGDNDTLDSASLATKRTDRKFDSIARPKYTNKPDRVIRNNYMLIFDGLMANLTAALKDTRNLDNIANALQKLNDAVNIWLEFNDYIPVPCYCPISQNILIRKTPRKLDSSLGGKRRKTRKSKHRKTKRNSRKTKKKQYRRKQKNRN